MYVNISGNQIKLQCGFFDHFSQMSFKRKRPGDWGTLGDGFEGLDVDKPQVKRQKDRGLPGARRLYTSKKDMNDDPSQFQINAVLHFCNLFTPMGIFYTFISDR